MIRQQAFCQQEKMLKGGLHCHTTRSDALFTPEEVMRFYHETGYDFLAITDHRLYNYKSFVPELPLTIIPGMEYDAGIICKGKGFRCYHTVCIGPEKEDGNGFEQDDYMNPGAVRSQEEYQVYLDEFHAKGNMTFYCHPGYSSTPARYFEQQKGNFAMEIWNTGAALYEGTDRDAAYWDELLGQGQVIYGVATDDGHERDQYCGGWVMVNAKNQVKDILDALKKGAFYSSCGPEIYDFYVDGNKAVVKCSPAAKIRFCSDMHPNRFFHAKEELLTGAELVLNNEVCKEYDYIRAVVIDQDGNYAWTNPIFLDGREEK